MLVRIAEAKENKGEIEKIVKRMRIFDALFYYISDRGNNRY